MIKVRRRSRLVAIIGYPNVNREFMKKKNNKKITAADAGNRRRSRREICNYSVVTRECYILF